MNSFFYSEQLLCSMFSNWVLNNSAINCFLAVKKMPRHFFFRPKKRGSIKTHEKILNSTPFKKYGNKGDISLAIRAKK